MIEENVQELLTWKDYIKAEIPTITDFCLKVVLAIVVFFIGTKLIRVFIKWVRKSLERTNLDAGVVQFVCSAGKWALYLFLVFNLALWLGVQASSVAALMGTLGVTIGLGLQGGLSNLAGGILLLLFKPFVVGDYIVQDSASGCEGTVSRIEMCYTTLLSIDNKKIVIPNGTLSNSTIINVTAKESRQLEIKVGISYESDLQKAKKLLETILLDDPDTKGGRDQMAVFVDELADSAVILGLRVWVPTDQYFPVKWRLNEKIKETFDAAGIEIPYNQMEVYVHQKNP